MTEDKPEILIVGNDPSSAIVEALASLHKEIVICDNIKEEEMEKVIAKVVGHNHEHIATAHRLACLVGAMGVYDGPALPESGIEADIEKKYTSDTEDIEVVLGRIATANEKRVLKNIKRLKNMG